MTAPSVARGQSLLPSECTEADACLCMKGDDVDFLNGKMVAFEQCQAKEAEYREALDKLKGQASIQEADPWWKSGEVVVGGVVVSFAVGGLIGFLIAR